MKIPKIDYLLREYANIMVKQYKWLTVKFEYNEDTNNYLVSYSPKDKIQSDDNFMRDRDFVEDFFKDVYGDLAPLFCNEEELFKLSPNAEVIKYESK